VRARHAYYYVTTVCRVLEVSSSGYYAWCKRTASTRKRGDKALTERIRSIPVRLSSSIENGPTPHVVGMLLMR